MLLPHHRLQAENTIYAFVQSRAEPLERKAV